MQLKKSLIALVCCITLAGSAVRAESISGAPIALPDMLVKLQGNAGKTTYLKIKLKIELEKEEDRKAFEKFLPHLEKELQTYLNALRLEDLKGSAGILKLKTRLMDITRAAAPDIPVKDVHFEEILVQQ
jgi:flagellar protein FliL